MAQSPKRGLYGSPCKRHLGGCAIYSETTVCVCMCMYIKLAVFGYCHCMSLFPPNSIGVANNGHIHKHRDPLRSSLAPWRGKRSGQTPHPRPDVSQHRLRWEFAFLSLSRRETRLSLFRSGRVVGGFRDMKFQSSQKKEKSHTTAL